MNAIRTAPMRRRLWPWLLGGLALIVVLMAVAGTAALALLADASREGVNISINGESWDPGFIDPEQGVLALLGVAAALLAVLVVVSVVVVLGLTLGLLGASLGVGIALLAVMVVLVAATSPLWLVALLLWLVLRRKPQPTAAAPTAS